jgi:hypothetical protein
MQSSGCFAVVDDETFAFLFVFGLVLGLALAFAFAFVFALALAFVFAATALCGCECVRASAGAGPKRSNGRIRAVRAARRTEVKTEGDMGELSDATASPCIRLGQDRQMTDVVLSLPLGAVACESVASALSRGRQMVSECRAVCPPGSRLEFYMRYHP